LRDLVACDDQDDTVILYSGERIWDQDAPRAEAEPESDFANQLRSFVREIP
jgi:hypothetical protein